MFAKFEGILSYLRNQLVNNTELASRVRELEAQVNELTNNVHNVVSQNAALQEAVNALTNERNEARAKISELESEKHTLQQNYTQRDNDANHWYAEFNKAKEDWASEVAALRAELESVKKERSDLETEHLHLLDDHQRATDRLKQIQSVFGSVNPEPVVIEEIKKPEEPQPRDPETQQWRGWDSKVG